MKTTDKENISNLKFSRLYWKISAIFLSILLIYSAITLYISLNAAREYALEVNQNLNRDLAANTIEVIKPLVNEGEINNAAIEDIVHSMMVINPSVEVYILDKSGKILSFVAPEKVVKMEEVSLEPVNRFFSTEVNSVVLGDDPRNPGEKKIFSVAPVIKNETLIGYIYIILASQEYTSAEHTVRGSYILSIAVKSIFLTLIITAIVGLLTIWFLTKKLNVLLSGINLFKKGDLSARIPVKSRDELDKVAMTFNDMAGTIQENIEKLKGLDKLRKELITNISHDLRTPVASIQGYSETLSLKINDLDKEEQMEYLEIINKSCQRLKTLVDDLFDLSKLESNQIKIQPEPFSISELINDIASKYRLQIKEKGLSLNTVIEKGVPLVKGDIHLISRVLHNLIDNAIKFCSDGDVITIEIIKKDRELVEVKVNDTGPGIPHGDLPFIFNRYYKSREGIKEENGESTGLGLAIVKKIMELHQSYINVNSQLYKGTEFTFALPVSNVS